MSGLQPPNQKNAENRIDAQGRLHEPCPNPRIVSLVPSLTELLFALELGDAVVGRTSFCIHPAGEVSKVPRIGGTKTPRIDKIAALAPTHVLVNVDENRREDVDALVELAIEPIVTHPLTVEDNMSLFRLLGAIFEREHQAQRLCADFRAARKRLSELQLSTAPRRVLYLIWFDPWMTVSNNTYIGSMLSLLNWTCVGHDPKIRYPTIDLVDIIDSKPDLIMLSSEPFPFKPKHREGLQRAFLEAGIAAPPIVDVDGEMMSWYGSRAIAALGYLRQLGQVSC